MLHRDEAPGIHRVEEADTNWYLVQEGNQLTVVDTGLPRSWSALHAALGELGAQASQIEAVLLTHGHFDHMGFARRAQMELGVPVWAHEREVSIVAHPWRYDHERSRLPYFRDLGFTSRFARMGLHGALWVRGLETPSTYSGGELDVPGRPQVVFTPGHTHGHCALLFADRGALLAGDAFVMLDPYTSRRGPCIVAGAATADSARALASLDALAPLDADVALTGHGPAWRGNLGDAVHRAREAGPA